MHRDLRVRFVDKMYKGGQYYNTKVGTLQLESPSPPPGTGPPYLSKISHPPNLYPQMIIEDVLSPDTCVCRTDEGRVLEGEFE